MNPNDYGRLTSFTDDVPDLVSGRPQIPIFDSRYHFLHLVPRPLISNQFFLCAWRHLFLLLSLLQFCENDVISSTHSELGNGNFPFSFFPHSVVFGLFSFLNSFSLFPFVSFFCFPASICQLVLLLSLRVCHLFLNLYLLFQHRLLKFCSSVFLSSI